VSDADEMAASGAIFARMEDLQSFSRLEIRSVSKQCRRRDTRCESHSRVTGAQNIALVACLRTLFQC
jgi:hypothetical protein